jgi:hypothetical protein
MSIMITFRQGIGLDIEYNNENCYRTDYYDDNGNVTKHDQILCYTGIIIKIPFFTIFIGDMYPIEEDATYIKNKS